MKNRIKRIRKELDLTQQKFSDKIGVKRGAIANYEIGRNEPTDAVLSLICREFNINEHWLRTGEGDMFLYPDRHSTISKFMNQLLHEETSSFKNRLVSVLADLSTEEWEYLERRMMQLYESKPATSSVDSDSGHEPTTAELEAEYKKSISSSAQNTSSTAMNITKENAKTGTNN